MHDIVHDLPTCRLLSAPALRVLSACARGGARQHLLCGFVYVGDTPTPWKIESWINQYIFLIVSKRKRPRGIVKLWELWGDHLALPFWLSLLCGLLICLLFIFLCLICSCFVSTVRPATCLLCTACLYPRCCFTATVLRVVRCCPVTSCLLSPCGLANGNLFIDFLAF